MAARYFELKRSGGQYMFNLRSTNGKVIVTSRLYTSKTAVQQCIKSIRKNALVAEIGDET